ncbi:ferric reductase NAD binding domain-containing protein [Myxozyma melibiosi]|uniref:ferric-chelate reductase (NADPH) n=1 Tax=Myxozyma melibiosi TaxID=54550 RepID=A0ABR1F542_9ASCO
MKFTFVIILVVLYVLTILTDGVDAATTKKKKKKLVLTACEQTCVNYVAAINSTTGCLSEASASSSSSEKKLVKRKEAALSTELDYTCACVDDIYLGSMALCIDQCPSGSQEKTWNYWTKLCKKTYKTEVEEDYDYYLNLAEDDYVLGGSYEGATSVPDKINSTYFYWTYRTRDAYYQNIRVSVFYGNALFAFFGLFMFISAVNRLFCRLLNVEKGAPNPIVTAIRKYFVLPAAFNGKHAESNKLFGIPFNVTPIRWVYVMVTIYSILNIAFWWTSVDIFEGNTNYVKTSLQRTRYLGDRAAVIATILFPSLYMFAGRNNILQYITGWSYETFNVLHRWTGRWMLIQASVHAMGYSGVYLINGGHELYMEKIWFKKNIIYGICATFIAGALIVQGAYPLRHKFYEVFKSIHVVLAAACLALTYKHVNAYGYFPWGYQKYIWATIGLWPADHFLRLCRIAYSGLWTTAAVSVIDNAVVIRVKPLIPWKPTPGQYAYLYVMRHNFWESHPFSIVGKENGEYIFVAKAEQGMTRKLHNTVTKSNNPDHRVNVWVEGFYGETQPVHRYNTVLLIGGGIGVTAVVGYALELARKPREGQHVILYWIVREEEQLGWIKQQIDECAATGRVDLRIFVTKGSPSPIADQEKQDKSSVNSTSDSDNEKSLSVSSNLTDWSESVKYGVRPDMSEIVSTTVREAPGSVAVLICGPPKMSDNCRRAVTENVDKGAGRVEYFEEVFSWA